MIRKENRKIKRTLVNKKVISENLEKGREKVNKYK